jgi:hypothetical protein
MDADLMRLPLEREFQFESASSIEVTLARIANVTAALCSRVFATVEAIYRLGDEQQL